MRHFSRLRRALATILVAASTARADAPPLSTGPESLSDVSVSASPSRAPTFALGVKAGGIFPQVLGLLSSTFSVGVEAMWISPLLESNLALDGELAFSQPSHSATFDDPRVPGGTDSFTITERTLAVFVGPKYFFLPPSGKLVPWLALGARIQFIDSRVVGSAQNLFGQHDETGTHLAYGGQAGLGYRLGPGLLALELQLISAPLDHLVTGSVNIGDLAARAVYLVTL